MVAAVREILERHGLVTHNSACSPFSGERGCARGARLLASAWKFTGLEPLMSGGREQEGEAFLQKLEAAGYESCDPADSATGLGLPRSFGRGHARPPAADLGRRGRRLLPAARIHHSRLAGLSRLGAGRRARRLLLLWPGVPPAFRPVRRNFRRPGSKISAAPTARRPTPKFWRWRLKRPAAGDELAHPHRRRRRCSRPCWRS